MENGVRQQEPQRRDGAAGASVRAGVALTCALFSFLATNGSIYPAVAIVDPWVREWATLFGVLVLIALVGVARYRPCWLRVCLFNGIALASVAGYLLLDGAGLIMRNPGLLMAGSLLDSLAEAWLFVLAYLAFAQLEAPRRPVVAMGACLAAYLLQPWANALVPTCAVAANALCFTVLFLCVRSLVGAPLREVRHSEPPAEMAVANPQSFLPFGHLLFVTIFVFSVAQGLVVALPGPFNEAPALPMAFLPLAVILVVYLARRRMPNADGLFALCALLIIAGMFLQPSDRVVSGGVVSASNTLIEAGPHASTYFWCCWWEASQGAIGRRRCPRRRSCWRCTGRASWWAPCSATVPWCSLAGLSRRWYGRVSRVPWCLWHSASSF